MAVKTITIDMGAYEALRRRKRAGQSFSDVIKEHFRGGATPEALRTAVRTAGIHRSTLDAVDALIRDRSQDMPQVEPL